VTMFLPTSIHIPQSLISCRWDQTIDGPPPTRCIVECGDYPYNFQEWTQNVAWVLCENFPNLCIQMESYIITPDNTFTLLLGDATTTTMQSALYRSRLVLNSNDENMREGFGWCNVLTFYNVLPLLCLILFILFSIPLIVGILMKAFVGVFRTAFSVYAMSHS
jgi:hypothetical protein